MPMGLSEVCLFKFGELHFRNFEKQCGFFQEKQDYPDTLYVCMVGHNNEWNVCT
jgi:hypothetical protein